MWKRATQIKRLTNEHNAMIKHLLVFGAEILSLDESGTLVGWDLKNGNSTFKIQMDKNKMQNPTVMLHPPTYLNKVLISSEKGYGENDSDLNTNSSPGL